MPRVFNTTGPCNAEDHYMLPPEARLPDLEALVEGKLYFVLHAARQTGKTTAMRAFAARMRARGYVAVWATLEECQGIAEIAGAEPLWLRAIARAASYELPPDRRPPSVAVALAGDAGGRLGAWLADWCSRVPAPVVLLLDEADLVSGPALVSLLRQLRAGFMDRGLGRFPVSIGLIGMRDLRDYLTASKDGVPVNPGSPFNIKAASLTLRNFTEAEVGSLYQQHTSDTGQVFLSDAVARVYYWTEGQPFLVNALARLCVMEIATDRSRVIDAAMIDEAKDRLILARTTHLDALGERLKEARVARIVEAVLVGDMPRAIPYDHDDFQYVQDLGLIRRGPDGAEVACPLYREVLARQLTCNLQESLTRPRWRWLTAEGRLDFPALVTAFLAWWRENADVLVEDVPLYPEAIPHLAFMAFLQRVVNGGGRVLREYAAGRRALDLLVEYGPDRFVVEIKRVRPRDNPESIRREGVAQVRDYLDIVGEREAWLLIFNQRPGLSWEQRLWTDEVEVDGRIVRLVGA